MPKIEIHESFRTIKQNDNLQIIHLENGLAAFKMTEIRTLEKSKGRSKRRPKMGEPFVYQGIATSKALKDYLSGKCKIGGGEFDLVSSEILEGLRQKGWSYGREEKTEWTLSDYFDVVARGGDYHVVKFLGDCHMLEDSAGQKLPVGIYFDYIAARIDNSTYDLEKAVAVLEKNPNIEFERDTYGGEDTRIRRIPYYNADCGASYYLSFWWAPPADEYHRLWDKCVSLGTKYPSTNKERAVWELDLLGLRKGGAAKYDDFYGRPDNDDNDEEDDY